MTPKVRDILTRAREVANHGGCCSCETSADFAEEIIRTREALERLNDWLSPDITATKSITFSVNAMNAIRSILRGVRL